MPRGHGGGRVLVVVIQGKMGDGQLEGCWVPIRLGFLGAQRVLL
jgi:hypothetical protein